MKFNTKALKVNIYIYIYIYIERERERDLFSRFFCSSCYECITRKFLLFLAVLISMITTICISTLGGKGKFSLDYYATL